MPDQTPPTRPTMAVISKNPDDPNAKHGRRLTRDLYDAMWEAWRDGDRRISTLAKIFGVSAQLADKVVKKGHIPTGWPSLNDRAKVWDAAKLQSDSLAAAAAFQEVRSAWDTTKAENIKLANFLKGTLAHAITKAREAVSTMKFVKYRRMLNRSVSPAVWETVETPMNGLEISEALRTLAAAVKDIGSFEAFWLGGKPLGDGEVANPFAGWSRLNPEQIEYIANTGQLPPGVTDEMLWGSATKIALGGPPKN